MGKSQFTAPGSWAEFRSKSGFLPRNSDTPGALANYTNSQPGRPARGIATHDWIGIDAHLVAISIARALMAEDQDDDRSEALDAFIQELTAAQTSLRAYILASIGGNGNEAADVLQRTNLALWKNVAKFRAGSPFMPWAIAIAKNEVRSFGRLRSRDRHVFPDDLAQLMAVSAEEAVDGVEDRIAALRHCLTTLPQRQREVLRERYFEGKKISQLAESMEQSENAVKCSLLRIRKALHGCIARRIAMSSGMR